MSAEGLPQVTIVFGSCTAGAAYVPAMCEENIMVDRKGYVFLGGPPLVQAATGEIVSAEELGGARVHCIQSGVSDHFALNDQNAIDIARNIIMNSNYEPSDSWAEKFTAPSFEWNGDLLEKLSDGRSTLSAHELIKNLADKNSFSEFKKFYGVDLVSGFCHLAGINCGVVANNGMLSEKGALKATSFIRICSQRKIPIVFIQNYTANKNKVTLEQEDQRGKAIVRLMSVLACSEVPKVTLIIGKSSGIENYAFCGRSFSPNFLFTWPAAQFCSHDGDSSVDMENMEEQQDAVYSSARLWDDGVIEPKDTKRVLALSLSCALNKPIPDSKFPVIRM
ncbi:methylcrotonoyl-CoA carboxylase beta chain, mitochondrial-like isoform X2 [Convolutriloba macropyga]